MTKLNIFISYARADEASMEELDKFLGPLERKGKINTWNSRKTLPGQPWKEEIVRNLENADLVLLLISADFLASDFIHKEEIPRAFERMEQYGKTVIPIILNYCFWNTPPFDELQVLPTDGKPIASYANPAQAWNEIATSIYSLVNKMQANSISKQSPNETSNINNSQQPSLQQLPEQLKILMLTANPSTGAKLNIYKEQAFINEKLQEYPNKIRLIVERAVDITAFKEFPETEQPHFLHFSGHGDDGGLFVHDDDKRGEVQIPTNGLDALFDYYQENGLRLRLVLLNACYSEAQAEVIAKHVPYVIGTTVNIGDKRAIAFSTGFYFGLVQKDFDVERAFKSGRTQAVLSGARKTDFIIYKNSQKITL